MGIGDRPQGHGRQPDQLPDAIRQPARPIQEGRPELQIEIRDGGLQVARGRGLHAVSTLMDKNEGEPTATKRPRARSLSLKCHPASSE